jgi:geranylgeranyl diphosphate synthase, type I
MEEIVQIPDIFAEWKRLIANELTDAMQSRMKVFGGIHELGPDSCERLESFSIAGKMIRGGLVCLGAALEDGTVPDDAVKAGAAIELFQSALLVHDDIMDRDETRRGDASVYMQYAGDAKRNGIRDALHIGESLGICAGDIAFFVAFEILSNLRISARNEIIALSSRELQYVGVAQLADVYRGALDFSAAYQDSSRDSEEAGSESETTLRVYLYKTGRYTFSLPLMIGALISGASQSRIENLERLGEKLGVLFQIKDDEIGLFGSESEIGKPVGSDIREGKKTIFYTELLGAIEAGDRVRLDRVFGNAEADDDDIEWIRNTVESCGVRARINDYVHRYAAEAESYFAALDGSHAPTMRLLRELHEYNMHRKR